MADDPKEFEFYRKKLVRYEEVSDRIEVQIFDFIDGLDRTAMSEETQQKARSLKRIAGELESLGDSGEAISRALVQKNDHGNHFSKEHLAALDKMVAVVDEAFDVMNYNLANFDTIQDINNAVDAEIAVNARRDALRNKEYVSGAEGDAYFNSMLFLKVLDELERMGDFIINVSQAIMSCRRLRK
jgi:phosphate:Na+ symporter